MKYLFVFILMVLINSCTLQQDSNVVYESTGVLVEYKTFAWLPKDLSQCQRAANTVYDDFFNNEITIQGIKSSANEELLRKGYSINVDTPDFLIQYRVVFEKKEHIVSAPNIINPNVYRGAFNNTQPLTNAPGIPFPTTYNRLSGSYTVYPDNYTYLGGGNIFPGVNNYNYSLNGNYWGGFYNNGYFYNDAPYAVSNYYEKMDYNEGTVIVDMVDRKTNQLIWRGWSQIVEQNPATAESSIKNKIRDILRKFPVG